MRARSGGPAVVLVALAVLASLPVAAGAAPAGEPPPGDRRIRPALRELLAAEPALDRDVIVRLKPGQGEDDARQVAHGVGAEGFDSYHLIPAFRARLTPAQIRTLSRDDRVLHVEVNARVRATLETARRWFGVDAAHDGGHLGGDGPTLPGADQVIAIVDTGIDGDTPALAGKVAAFVNCLSGVCVTASPVDDNGHGTHVAGIAAGAGTDPALHGVAPGAALVGIKVLDGGGGGSEASVLAGVQWAVANRASLSIDVLNLSLGIRCGGTLEDPCDGSDSLSAAVDAAVAAGLPVTVAAGNDGPGPGSVDIPGVASGAITVGAMADVTPGAPAAPDAGFLLADFSSRGPTSNPSAPAKPDIVAAGVAVRAACSHDASAYSSTSPNTDGCTSATTHSVVISGTSMAAPFVAGAVALLRHEAPSLTPAQLKATLAASAVPWGGDDHPGVPGQQSDDYGAGRLDVAAAVASVVNPDPTPPDVPAHVHVAGTLSASDPDACYQVETAAGFPLVATLLLPAGGSTNDLDLQVQRTAPGVNSFRAVDRTSNPKAAKAGYTNGDVGYTFGTGLVGLSDGTSRQEVVAGQVAAGTYQVVVISWAGTSSYDLDISNATSVGPCTLSAANGTPVAWQVTTTLTRPSASGLGWQAMTATAGDISSAGDGSITLYPWFKNAAGDVSSSAEADLRKALLVLDTVPPMLGGTVSVDTGPFTRARAAHTATWTPATDANLGSTPISLEVTGGSSPAALGGARANTGSAVLTMPDNELSSARVRAVATDLAGNSHSESSVKESSSFYLMRTGNYWLDAFGGVHRLGPVPTLNESRRFGFRIARGLAMRPGLEGGYVLDGYGGIHRFSLDGGSAAPSLGAGPYWGGWDIARDLALLPDGSGAYVLDGFGGIHPVGGAPAVTGAPYFGFDIAKRIVVLADGTDGTDGTGGYVLDGYGGVHPFAIGAGPLPDRVTTGPYFGFDIARSLVVQKRAGAVTGYLLDGYGGVHRLAFGGATPPPPASPTGYWSGWDIARGLSLLVDGAGGHVLDGFGGGHSWGAGGAVPALTSSAYPNEARVLVSR